MTVSTTTRKAGPFTGNGVTTNFPFAFRVFATTDIVAVAATLGVEATLVLGVDYTVALNVDQDGSPGGSITTTVPLANGVVLVLTSAVPQTQLTLVTNGGGFFPKVFNAVFDKAVILIQQLAEKLGRALTISITATGVTSLQVPVLASGVLQWKPDGTAIQAILLPDLSLQLALPAQGGHNGHVLFSNGVSPLWRAVAIADITDLNSQINYCRAAVGQVPTLAQINNAVDTRVSDAVASARNFSIAAAIVF